MIHFQVPPKTNLLQWGKTTSDLYKLCLDANQDLRGNRKETTHPLNGFKASLNQQRYTWGHDNILKYICENVDGEKYQLNADIDGYFLPGGGTIYSDSVLPMNNQISSSMTD